MNSLFLVVVGLVAVSHAAEKIINGKDALILESPWQVSLQLTGSHFCGGSIISTKYAFSAAHCQDAYDDRLEDLTVVAGISLLSDSKQGQIRSMASWVRHPLYGADPDLIDYDYSVITVTEEFITGMRVQSVNYAKDPMITYAGEWGTTTGWGLTDKGPLGVTGESTDVLQTTQLLIMSNEDCAVSWEGITNITDTMLCAGGSGASGSCNGDSGGPIVVYENDGTPTLVGDVSFGLTTCSTSFPTVYGRLSTVADWICENTPPCATKMLQ